MKHFFTIFILSYSVTSNSQAFEIFNSKSKAKILTTDYLQVGVKISDNESCCDLVEFEGNFTSMLKDSVMFNFSSSRISLELNSSEKRINMKYLNNYPNKTIALKDIVYLTDYKSKKSNKTRENLSIVGGLIMVGGVLTTLNALVFTDNSKKDLLIAGGVQFGAGFILGLSSHKRPKKFKIEHDPWTFK